MFDEIGLWLGIFTLGLVALAIIGVMVFVVYFVAHYDKAISKDDR